MLHSIKKRILIDAAQQEDLFYIHHFLLPCAAIIALTMADSSDIQVCYASIS